jgi:hypothetical protein
MTLSTCVAALLAIGLAELPPPPGKVELRTASFGTVAFDHPAHLARKISCATCHGPGPVSKPQFTPKTAHGACLGCHKTIARGPRNCRECHEVPTGSEAAVAKQLEPGDAAAANGLVVASSTQAASNPLPPPPPPAAQAGPHLDDFSTYELPAQRPFTAVISAGYAAQMNSDATASTGPAVTVMLRESEYLMLQSFGRVLGNNHSATVGLVGAGVIHPLRRGWNRLLVGVAGFDAPDGAGIMPTAGVQFGFEWLGSRSSFMFMASGLMDLASETNELGRHFGGATLSLSMSVGVSLDTTRPPRR